MGKSAFPILMGKSPTLVSDFGCVMVSLLFHFLLLLHLLTVFPPRLQTLWGFDNPRSVRCLRPRGVLRYQLHFYSSLFFEKPKMLKQIRIHFAINENRVLYRSGHSVGLTESDVDSVSRYFFFFL